MGDEVGGDSHPEPTRTARNDLPATIGRYSIIGELGSGGMADVYLGRSFGMGGFERLIAIKTIHPHLAKQTNFVRMFLDEARIAARVRHPNVVQVYEVGQEGNRLFIAMDYVSGESLSATMRRLTKLRQPMDLGVAGYLAFAACEALHAAHESKDAEGRLLGVIHRDVSPKNMIIGYDGNLRLLDFGVAKARDQLDTTVTGTRKGTAAYMAPELIEDNLVDRRADVFALGVVLWEITTGKRLFKGSNDIATVENVRRCRVPRPSSLRAEYPGKLERVVLKALRRNPDDRYATARELGEDLREVLGSRAKLLSSIDVEKFIHVLFADRYQEKQEMERNALSAAPLPFQNLRESSSIDMQGVSLDDLPGDDLVDKTLLKPSTSQEASIPRLLDSSTGHPVRPRSATKKLVFVLGVFLLLGGVASFAVMRRADKETTVQVAIDARTPLLPVKTSSVVRAQAGDTVVPPVAPVAPVAPVVVAPIVVEDPIVVPNETPAVVPSKKPTKRKKGVNDPTLVGGGDL